MNQFVSLRQDISFLFLLFQYTDKNTRAASFFSAEQISWYYKLLSRKLYLHNSPNSFLTSEVTQLVTVHVEFDPMSQKKL